MSTNNQQLKHRDVVSNFLFRSDARGEPLVALFRRSTHPDIHSYPGKLAPISGSIDASDADPLSAAVRELHEETQLVADKDIILEFCGKPFSFADHELGRSWTVHPFGWRLEADESRIEIDWEHSGWEWVHPQKVLSEEISADCVPRLNQSLERVYFGPGGIFPGKTPLVTRKNAAGKTFMSGLQKLKNDHENGARVLATEALRCLCQIIKDIQNETIQRNHHGDDQWLMDVRIAAWHLIYSARPSMNAAISSAILRALKTVVPPISSDQSTDLSQVTKLLDDSIASRSDSSLKISEALKSYVTPFLSQSQPTINIITLSSSSTIRSALLHLLTTTTNITINLSILESRPLSEGASLATSLISTLQSHTAQSSSRLNITLAPDTHISLLLPNANTNSNTSSPQAPTIILLGADRIHPNGHVSNKTGSFPLAFLFRHLHPPPNPSTPAPIIRTIILSETDKIAKPDSSSSTTATLPSPPHSSVSTNPLPHMLSSTHTLSTDPGPSSDVLSAYPDDIRDKLTPYLHNNNNNNKTEDKLEITLTIKNEYFEWIPADYIDVYVTEEGVLGVQEIGERSRAVGALEGEILGGDWYGDEE